MTAVFQVSRSFRAPPAYIPYSGPPKERNVRTKKAPVHQLTPTEHWPAAINASSTDPDSSPPAGEDQTSVDALSANCSGNQENPIEIESGTSESTSEGDDDADNEGDDGHCRDSESDHDEEDNDDDLPPVSDLLRRRPSRPQNQKVADESRQENVGTRRSSTQRSPTPSNDYNTDTARGRTEVDRADNTSAGGFCAEADRVDGAEGPDENEGVQAATHHRTSVAGGGHGDIGSGNVDDNGVGTWMCCEQGGGNDSLAGRDASSSPSLCLQATQESRKRRYESVSRSGEPSDEHDTQASRSSQARPDSPSPTERMKDSLPLDAAKPCDKPETDDTTHSHSPEPVQTNLYSNKRQRTAQASPHGATTISDHQLNACETTRAGLDCRIVGSEFIDGGVATNVDRSDEDTSIPMAITQGAEVARHSDEDVRGGDDTAPRLDDAESQEDALRRVGISSPLCSSRGSIGAGQDKSSPRRPSPALGNLDNQGASTVAGGSPVPGRQMSSVDNEDHEMGHDREEVHHPRNNTVSQRSPSSKPGGKDALASRGQSHRGSGRRIRRPAAGVEKRQMLRRVRGVRATPLDRVDESDAEFEREKTRQAHRRLQRRGASTLASQDRNMRRMAGRRIPKLPQRLSSDPDPNSLPLEVSHDREMQLNGPDKCPRMAPARVAVTIRPVSKDSSMLIALGRGDEVPMLYDDVASAIEHAVGGRVKLQGISIDPLPPGAWLLIGLICEPDEDEGGQTGNGQLTAQASDAGARDSQSELRLRPRPQSLSSIRSGGEDQQWSDSDGGDSSDASDGSRSGGASTSGHEPSEEHERSGEESDGLGARGWKSRHVKNSPWAESEDEHLRRWVIKGRKPRWEAIFRLWPMRTDAAVRGRGYKVQNIPAH